MSGDSWKFSYYPDTGAGNLAAMLAELRSCDIVYQIGGRITLGKFLRAAKYLGKKRIVMHWIGSDVLTARPSMRDGRRNPRLVQEALHWAETPWMQDEVRQFGLRCETMALPGARLATFPTPLRNGFSVLIYVPGTQRYAYYGAEPTRVSQFYGLESIVEIAQALPDIPFEVVGVRDEDLGEKPRNLRGHGQVAGLQQFYDTATVLWRPVAHDGLSFMVLEALAHGRHVIWSYAFPGCRQATTANEAKAHILELKELHDLGELELNGEGLRAIDESYRPEYLRRRILERLELMVEP